MTTALLFTVHCLLSTVGVLCSLERVSTERGSRQATEAIENFRATLIASNAIHVTWQTELMNLTSDSMCQLNMTAEDASDFRPIATKMIPAKVKRYTFWVELDKNRNYSVSIALISTEELSSLKNVNLSPKYLSIIRYNAGEPVSLHGCTIDIQHGFMRQLDITQVTDVIYTEQDNITLSCEVSGFPSPKAHWLKDGKDEEMSVGSLTISVADKAAEGLYSYIAENEFGKVVYPGVRLKMAVLDPFSAMDQTPKFTVEVGVGQTIDCRYSAQSVPEATVRWYRLSGKNDPNPTPVSPDNSRVLLAVSGSLVFVNTELTDSGLYMCMLKNSELDKSVAGSLTYLEITQSRYTNFSVAPQQLFKSLDTQKVFFGENVSIQCIFSGRPIPETVWSVKDPLRKTFVRVTEHSFPSLQFRHSRTTLFIPRVDEMSPEQFKCEGRNSEGLSQPAQFQLLIYEKPRLVVSPQSSNATIGETATFTYHVTGRPKPEIRWTKKDKDILQGRSVFINDSHLIIYNVTKEWSSSLQLKVSNNHGDSLANVFLKVIEPTRIVSFVKDVSHYDPPGVSFHCDAITDPSTPLEIKWYINNRPVTTSTSPSPSFPAPFSFEDERSIRVINNDVLWLNTNDDDDHVTDGKWRSVTNVTCYASNGYSTVYRTITVSHGDDNKKIDPGMLSHGSGDGADPKTLLSCLAYSACGVIVVVVIVVVIIKRRRIYQSTQSSSEAAAAATTITTSSLTRRQNNSYSGPHHGHHLHSHRCDSQQCRGALLGNSNGGGGLSMNMLTTGLHDLYIPRDRLQVTETIAQGRFGQVLLAYLHDPRGELRETVAVKVLNSDLLETDTVELFLREAEFSKNFQDVNVLGVIGVTYERSGGPLVIQPFMSNGDLRGYIANPRMDLTVLNLLQFGLQVVRGMSYLSNLPVVHCHLRARSCMINNRGIVKVGGFGLTRELIMRGCHRDPENGIMYTMRWMAPETLEANIFTTMSDVWSFGVLLWELMTRGVLPYHETKDADIPHVIQSGSTLPQPPYCPDDVFALMTTCWSHDPLQRPKFDEIGDTISRILRSAQRWNQSNNNNGNNCSAMYENLITPPQVFNECFA